MSWQTLRLSVRSEDVPAVEALLTLAGAAAVSLADAGSTPQLEPPPQETPLWPAVGVQALFPLHVELEALARVLEATFPEALIERGTLGDDDWRSALAEPVIPRRIGTIELLGADSPPSGARGVHAVRLHMGFAFGTGEHPTTRLCLASLDAERPSDVDVLDYGCGSGVLALAALALGATHAFAVDNDDQALVAARRNAELNRVGDRLWIGSPDALPERRFGVVLANILAGPLVELAPALAARTTPGGRIVLSGILESQVEGVQAAYAPYFESLRAATEDGWARIDARRTR